MKCQSESDLVNLLIEEARHGRISRRDFMNCSLATGLSALTATGLWTTSAAAQPKKGGTFRWGIHDGSTTDTHDPGTYVTHQMVYLAHQYRSYLTMILPDNSLGPDLATKWEATPRATEWIFEIHRNATFHSGKPVTAEDVIASLNHHRRENSSSAAKSLLADINDIVKNGEHTITIKLARGIADLPWLMTDYHLAICPANDDGTIDWQSGDGCGPYKIDSGEFGIQWQLSRHDGWHGEGAYFDKVVMLVLNDPNARQTALVAGDVDCVSQVELKTLERLQRNPNILVDNVQSGATVTMPMHCDTPPFDDVNVRTALKLAMNREEIVDKIAFGAATIGNDFHVAPVQPYWPDDIPQRSYDPDKAKSLLKKAGHENLSVNLSTADSVFSGAVDMCVLYAQQAKAAGININVVREPNDGYFSDVWLKKPFAAVSWGARPTPDVMFTLVYKADAAWNESHWRNERFNELLLQAKSELDDNLRTEMYHEMCLLMRNDGGTLLPFFNNFVYARRKSVQHPEKVAASWACDGARAPSRWWFA